MPHEARRNEEGTKKIRLAWSGTDATTLPLNRAVFVRHRVRAIRDRVASDGSVRVTCAVGMRRSRGIRGARAGRGSRTSSARGGERARREHERQRGTANGESAERPLSRAEARASAAGQNELPPRCWSRRAVRCRRFAHQHQDQRWRWGSCNRDGHICLTGAGVDAGAGARLRAIHELMHLKRMDIARFWKAGRRRVPGVQRSARLAAKPERALNSSFQLFGARSCKSRT